MAQNAESEELQRQLATRLEMLDSIYGVSEVERALRRAGKGYVLAVNSTSQFNSRFRK